MHAETWLENFMLEWERTVLIVSHDRSFLDAVTDYTILFKRKRLFYFGGNYTTYLRVKAEQQVNQTSMAAQQQRKVVHLKKFI